MSVPIGEHGARNDDAFELFFFFLLGAGDLGGGYILRNAWYTTIPLFCSLRTHCEIPCLVLDNSGRNKMTEGDCTSS